MRLSELTNAKADELVTELRQQLASRPKQEKKNQEMILTGLAFQKHTGWSQFGDASLPLHVTLLLPATKIEEPSKN